MAENVLALLFLLCAYTVNSQCTGTSSLQIFPGLLSYHETGSRVGTTGWKATVLDKSEAFLTYGPYSNQISSQPSAVSFTLQIDNNIADNIVVAIVDVNDATTQQQLVSREIHRTDFVESNRPQNFTLFFSNTRCSRSVEFRVYYACCSAITHTQTIYWVLEEGPLGSLWNLNAHFDFISEANFSTSPQNPGSAMANVGSYIVPIFGVWYLFHREFYYTSTPSYCTNVIPISRTVVRISKDQGRTWSDKVPIAEPIPGTPSECAVLDGSAHYDAETNTWHLLAQCLGRSSGWGMCHYSVGGQDPMKPFTPNPKNPVVTGGQLWHQICSGNGKHCTMNTVDEGTPDIVKKVNGYFYVTFHGYDYSAKKSARGVAKTPNFVNWIVQDFDLPGDAIFSSVDCNPWNVTWATGGCVGGGEGDILISGDYMYELIEAPDISLGCDLTLGQQNWVIGLMRSPNFGISGTWEEFPRNPMIIPWHKVGCTIQYHRIFYDSSLGKSFVSFFVGDYVLNHIQMKVYEINPGAGAIPLVAILP